MAITQLRKLLADALKGTPILQHCYFAGGCVRDFLMDSASQPKDIDIAVEAPNGGEIVASLIHERLGSSQPIIYNSFGTAASRLKDWKLEFVQTRRESYRERDRKPDVSLGSLLDDASRRDFGINALYMRILDGQILDPTGKGLCDLEAKVIRCVDEPGRVFREDPLRLLRAVRFSTRFGFAIEPQTWTAIKIDADRITDISWERIAAEFNAMLCHPDSEKVVSAIRLLHQSGILHHILPEFADLSGLTQNKYHHLDAFDHSLEVLRHSAAGSISRWAALLHDIGKPGTARRKADGSNSFIGHEQLSSQLAGQVLRRFQVPRPQRIIIKSIIAGHMRFKNSGDEGLGMKDVTLLRIADAYQETLWALLDLAHADNLAHAPEYLQPHQIEGLKRRYERILTDFPKFSLTGRDLMDNLGIPPGPELGNLLQLAKDAWFQNPALDKNALLDYIITQQETKEEPD